MWSPHLGTVKGPPQWVDVNPGTHPIKHLSYREGPNRRHIIDYSVDEMLAAVAIDPSQTECASLIVKAPKKYGTERFCIDYRRLNKITIPDAYLIPR